MRLAAALTSAWIGAATAASPQGLAAETAPEPQPEPGSTLPDEPTKGLVLVQCNICHGLAWIERSGANLDGWTSRIQRMIRAGAQIPPEQISLLAEYLAKALPERPRPPPPPKKHGLSPHNPTR